MESDPKFLEKQAYNLLCEEKFEQAYKLFKEAAILYKDKGNHSQAALCFASAASCWSKRSGEKTFYNSAVTYEEAAKEAENCRDFEYASLLYKFAAINYERDIEFLNFSECVYRSKECYRKFLTYSLFCPLMLNSIRQDKSSKKSFLIKIVLWFFYTFSYILWGYGERPLRTFIVASLVIFMSAFFYTFGNFFSEGLIFKPNFLQALYFSVVTFTTVGYGDFLPVGLNKIVAIIEMFSGIFVMPLFIVSLSRKYLRV